MSKNICPICGTQNCRQFFGDKIRTYLLCPNCQLIFVPSEFFLSAEDEKSRYDMHENNSNDHNYRTFLSKLFNPMIERIKAKDLGLDFGSGPGPTLSVMFKEAGHKMKIYDHFYENNPSVLEKKYDFITATEVVEHLHKPKEVLDKLWSILKPGSTLGLMTKLSSGTKNFKKWHYKNDDTHVCFFSKITFEWLAKQWNAEIEFIGVDVILLRKTINQ